MTNASEYREKLLVAEARIKVLEERLGFGLVSDEAGYPSVEKIVGFLKENPSLVGKKPSLIFKEMGSPIPKVSWTFDRENFDKNNGIKCTLYDRLYKAKDILGVD